MNDEGPAHITSLGQDYAGGWQWVCTCGAESRKVGDRADIAWLAEMHRWRMERRNR